MLKLSSVVVIVFALIACASAGRRGVLSLDSVNFPKIVDGKYNILIQLAEYDWKLETTYNRVADAFADRKDVIVASLETSGENDNLIKETFGGVQKSDLPKTFWIPAGKTVAEPVSGNDAEFLTDFVNTQLNPSLRDLKNMAQQYISSDKKPDLLKEAEALVAKELKGVQHAEWIVLNMRKIQEKGVDFVSKEKTRLEGLVANKSTLPAKKTEFQKRISALNAFQAAEAK